MHLLGWGDDGGQGGGVQSIFLRLLGLDDFQLKVTFMSQLHILGWPALGPYIRDDIVLNLASSKGD